MCAGCAMVSSTAFAASADQGCQGSVAGQRQVPLVDHHTHVLTPRSTHWADVQGVSLKPRGIEDLLTTMRKDGVRRAAVLSTAYWFGHSTDKVPRNYRDLRIENDNIGRLVSNYPKRLVAFFGINPLAPTALSEIRRDVKSGLFVGIKLHLTNSDVDLRNPADLQKLAEVFALANKLRVPIVIHLRTRRSDYGYVDASNFIKKVLVAAPNITVQIAHLAGWGGYDSNTDDALRAFVDNKDRIQTKLYFDIAAIVTDTSGDESRDKDAGKRNAKQDDSVSLHWPDKAEAATLAKRIREIGLKRIVFGTDWPFGTQAHYWAEFSEQVPLTACELETIRGNRAPWLQLGDGN